MGNHNSFCNNGDLCNLSVIQSICNTSDLSHNMAILQAILDWVCSQNGNGNGGGVCGFDVDVSELGSVVVTETCSGENFSFNVCDIADNCFNGGPSPGGEGGGGPYTVVHNNNGTITVTDETSEHSFTLDICTLIDNACPPAPQSSSPWCLPDYIYIPHTHLVDCFSGNQYDIKILGGEVDMGLLRVYVDGHRLTYNTSGVSCSATFDFYIDEGVIYFNQIYSNVKIIIDYYNKKNTSC